MSNQYKKYRGEEIPNGTLISITNESVLGEPQDVKLPYEIQGVVFKTNTTEVYVTITKVIDSVEGILGSLGVGSKDCSTEEEVYKIIKPRIPKTNKQVLDYISMVGE